MWSNREVQLAIVEWFHMHKRLDLPWRQPCSNPDDSTDMKSLTYVPNPYYIWVSEVMSQQTQMDTVIRYFKRWICLFPNVSVLAEASDDSVKAAWAGMGYYRRALFLKKGAEHVMQHFDGKLPKTAAQLRQVPGIGPYTAAAIASICFGEKIISVDGNMVRVLSRLRCERDFDPKKPKNIRLAMEWGQKLMDEGFPEEPGALNQGLMEIGARVCKPAGRPLCDECPIQHFCNAHASRERGEIEVIEGIIPLKAAATKRRKETVVCVVHEFHITAADGNPTSQRFIVVRRPEGGLLGGMLEFPSVTYSPSQDTGLEKETEEKGIMKLHARLSAGHSDVLHMGSIQHIFSHIDMKVIVYRAIWSDQKLCSELFVKDKNTEWGNNCAVEQVVCASLAAELHVDSSRIYVKTEEEIRNSASSRLLLKILHISRSSLEKEEINMRCSPRKRLRAKT